MGCNHSTMFYCASLLPNFTYVAAGVCDMLSQYIECQGHVTTVSLLNGLEKNVLNKSC
jgi:hypothetical protein